MNRGDQVAVGGVVDDGHRRACRLNRMWGPRDPRFETRSPKGFSA